MSTVGTLSQQTASSDEDTFDLCGRTTAGDDDDDEEEEEPSDAAFNSPAGKNDPSVTEGVFCEWRSSVWQQNSNQLHVEEEEEEEGEQLAWLQESDIITVVVNSDYEEKNPQISTEMDGKSTETSESEVTDDDDTWDEPLSLSAAEIKDIADKWERKRFKPTKNKQTDVFGSRQEKMTSKTKSTAGNDEKMRSGPERRHSCDICGQRFTSSSGLKGHMMSHTGERPFGCDVCGKCFRYKGNLKDHMGIHTGVKPFGCDRCTKSFRRKRNLELHLRVHTKEKPFGCDVCGQSFTQAQSLKRHKVTHFKKKTR
ncbi:zinc finger protein 90-like [Gouania willdenowi]|uniref:Zinc finger protein 90-like n=1 Tax=Gouania willdenowi TaxID=441366 RepID=A0A8C5FY95_GOUWI|nr:zinc finger protein 90-like [Gouania willdenowi]